MKRSVIVAAGMALAVFCTGCAKTEKREFKYDNGNPRERYTVREFDGNYLKQGDYLSWHPNGVKQKSVVFSRGNLVGKCQEWYENGQTRLKGEFANNEREGCWLLYDSNGKEVGRATFKDGNPVGDFCLEDFKHSTIRCELRDGAPAGKFLYEYDKDGLEFGRKPKRIEGNIRDGQPKIKKADWGEKEQPWDGWYDNMIYEINKALSNDFML